MNTYKALANAGAFIFTCILCLHVMRRPVVYLLIHLSSMITVSIGDDIQYGALLLVGNIRGSYLRHKKIRGTLSPSYPDYC